MTPDELEATFRQWAGDALARTPTLADIEGFDWPRDVLAEAQARLDALLPGAVLVPMADGGICLLTYLDTRMVEGELKAKPSAALHRASKVHELWWGVHKRYGKRTTEKHPFLPLVRWWRTHPAPRRHTRRPSGNLPHLHKAKESIRDLPDMGGFSPTPERQATLPGMNLDELGQPSWLVELYKLMGGEFLREGRGAPLELRMYVGALCAFDIEDRDGYWHTRRYTVDELIRALWPNGWTNRWRDWRKLPEAIARLNRSSATLLKADGMAMDIFRITGQPTLDSAWKSGVDPERKFVEFTMRIPPSSARGDRVDMDRLAQLGVRSAPLYCGLLSAYAHVGRTARRGLHTRLVHPALQGPDGKPVRKRVKTSDGKTRAVIDRDVSATVENPINKYQGAPLTAHALARMCGLDPGRKQYRRRAIETYERLHDEGDLELAREGGGFRIYSPPVA